MEFAVTVETKNTLTMQINHPAGMPLAEVEAAALEYLKLKPSGDGAEFEVTSSKARGHLRANVGTTVRFRRTGTTVRPYKPKPAHPSI